MKRIVAALLLAGLMSGSVVALASTSTNGGASMESQSKKHKKHKKHGKKTRSTSKTKQ